MRSRLPAALVAHMARGNPTLRAALEARVRADPARCRRVPDCVLTIARAELSIPERPGRGAVVGCVLELRAAGASCPLLPVLPDASRSAAEVAGGMVRLRSSGEEIGRVAL